MWTTEYSNPEYDKVLDAGVALVPGTAFGAPGYLRLSFATSTENLTKALDRMDTVFGVG